MSSFVSKTIGRYLLPNFEKDLTKAVSHGLQSSAKLTDCFLPPVVYGFEKYAYGGIGHATSSLERRIAMATTPPPTFEKVYYRPLPKGLFR